MKLLNMDAFRFSLVRFFILAKSFLAGLFPVRNFLKSFYKLTFFSWKSSVLVRGLASLTVILVMAGCSEKTLLQDLSQEQAQAVVSALVEQGISAESIRDKGSKAAFRVVVDEGSYSDGMALLSKLGLPGESRSTVSSLLASQGLFPSSRALDNLRLERAQAAELEEALLAHAGIQTVRAIIKTSAAPVVGELNAPDQDTSPHPSVAVVIDKKPGAELDRTSILSIILAAVPGSRESSVTLLIDEGADKKYAISGVERVADTVTVGIPLTRFLGIWRMPDNEHNRVASVLALALSFAVIVGFAVGFAIASYRKRTAARSFKKTDLRLNNPDGSTPPKLLQNGR